MSKPLFGPDTGCAEVAELALLAAGTSLPEIFGMAFSTLRLRRRRVPWWWRRRTAWRREQFQV